MKTTTMIARIMLGLTFLVFGLNGLFQFIKLPPRSGVALQFLSLSPFYSKNSDL
jgi:putative oxidoreductase